MYTVTNLNTSGANSLEWPISGADSNPGPDEIVFLPSLFATPKTIKLGFDDFEVRVLWEN